MSVGTLDERALPPLTAQEVLRYSRHLILPEVGKAGQQKLKSSRVALVGAGGLGSPLGLYLAAAGVGTLGLIDSDVVDETNLQRQILHGTSDVGRSKIASAKKRIADVNPNVRVEPHETRLDSGNALEILGAYDLIVDGTDNFPTRYLVNDASVLLGVPYVYGSVFRFEGQVSVFGAKDGPCYRCLFRVPPPPGMVPSCAEGGVLGVLPGLIGTAQALEALKLLLGIGEPLIGRLAMFDGLTFRWREVRVRRHPECPVCGPNPTITGLIDYAEFCGMPAVEAEAAADRNGVSQWTPQELKSRLDRGDRLTLIDVREPHEWDIVNLGEYGATLIPPDTLLDRVNSLELEGEVLVYCRTGNRSAKAIRQLKALGFERLHNLEGGIVAWANEIDPDLPTY